jgi:glycine/D-amino acid oxidase-like deaminating enzyme
MSYEENEALWQQLHQRLSRIHDQLEEKTHTDNLETRRAVTLRFYQQGWIQTNLMYCRPRRDRSAITEAAELATLQQEIDNHEVEANQI